MFSLYQIISGKLRPRHSVIEGLSGDSAATKDFPPNS